MRAKVLSFYAYVFSFYAYVFSFYAYVPSVSLYACVSHSTHTCSHTHTCSRSTHTYPACPHICRHAAQTAVCVYIVHMRVRMLRLLLCMRVLILRVLVYMCPHTALTMCPDTPPMNLRAIAQHTSAYVSIRQHTSAYVSIREYT